MDESHHESRVPSGTIQTVNTSGLAPVVPTAANRVLSGLNANWTVDPCEPPRFPVVVGGGGTSRNTLTDRPVPASHSLTVPWLPAVAIHFPSGESVADRIRS